MPKDSDKDIFGIGHLFRVEVYRFCEFLIDGFVKPDHICDVFSIESWTNFAPEFYYTRPQSPVLRYHVAYIKAAGKAKGSMRLCGRVFPIRIVFPRDFPICSAGV